MRQSCLNGLCDGTDCPPSKCHSNSIRAPLALVCVVGVEKETYQQSCHAKQQHVDKVCCAKLEGDLLQLAAILNAAQTTLDEPWQCLSWFDMDVASSGRAASDLKAGSIWKVGQKGCGPSHPQQPQQESE